MIAYQILDISNSNADAVKYTPTAEGKAFGNTPGFVAFLDPNYASIEKGVLNRVNNQDFWLSSTGNMPLSTFANGEKCFAPTKDTLIQIRPKANFPQSDWSVFFVAQAVEGPSQAEGGLMQAIVTGDSSADYTPALRFFRSGEGFAVMKSGGLSDGTRRLTLSDAAVKNVTKVYVVTFSVKNGLSIYVNGVKRASVADANVIANDYLAGKWSIMRGFMGKAGMIGILSIDLNDATNDAYRNNITNFLMQKYSVQ